MHRSKAQGDAIATSETQQRRHGHRYTQGRVMPRISNPPYWGWVAEKPDSNADLIPVDPAWRGQENWKDETPVVMDLIRACGSMN